MILQSLAGLPAFLVYFCTALVAVVAYLFVYTRVTPHDEFQLIRDNDPAAAIALGLSLLGFVLAFIALFIAAGSFFSIRERVAKILPEPLTTAPIRMLPILLIFGAMFYWLWRVRRRRPLPVSIRHDLMPLAVPAE